MPAQLIGEGEELTKAYELFLEHKDDNKDAASVHNSEDSDDNHQYHEGKIPKYRKKANDNSEKSLSVLDGMKVSHCLDKTETETKLNKTIRNVTLYFPKSIYKNLSGHSAERLANLLDFNKKQSLNET